MQINQFHFGEWLRRGGILFDLRDFWLIWSIFSSESSPATANCSCFSMVCCTHFSRIGKTSSFTAENSIRLGVANRTTTNFRLMAFLYKQYAFHPINSWHHSHSADPLFFTCFVCLLHYSRNGFVEIFTKFSTFFRCFVVFSTNKANFMLLSTECTIRLRCSSDVRSVRASIRNNRDGCVDVCVRFMHKYLRHISIWCYSDRRWVSAYVRVCVMSMWWCTVWQYHEATSIRHNTNQRLYAFCWCLQFCLCHFGP